MGTRGRNKAQLAWIVFSYITPKTSAEINLIIGLLWLWEISNQDSEWPPSEQNNLCSLGSKTPILLNRVADHGYFQAKCSQKHCSPSFFCAITLAMLRAVFFTALGHHCFFSLEDTSICPYSNMASWPRHVTSKVWFGWNCTDHEFEHLIYSEVPRWDLNQSSNSYLGAWYEIWKVNLHGCKTKKHFAF